ncbi:MAG: HU family DNA-binding protein [Candidatus Euphemobacter frigidus]|nr:HU family DNA-binding protein [Candidatus Euphemobacter frigidus]MDP8275545.1 HU family DNA-binding protein [Candidatus Euphemobacter frigidus]
MTKRDLVVKIARETALTQLAVKEVIQKFLDDIIDDLTAGKNVEFRNFGVFQCVYRKPRIGRNPRKPEDIVEIPGRYVVRFKQGKEMKIKMARRQGTG